METYFNYIIESGISLGIFTLIYWLLLRKEVLLKASRVYLLVAVLFSTLLPFLSIDLSSWNKPEAFAPATREIVLETNLLETITVTASGFPAKVGQAIVSIKPSVWFYSVGALFVLFFLITGIAQLFAMISNNKRFRLRMTRLIISSKAISPYSFFNYIFISRELPEQENWKSIVHHELEHVRQGHSFDVLFVDFMMVFQWFNPFYWIIRRLVRENHEFLADRAVIQRGSISTGNYKALLLSQAIGGRPIMTSNFINVKTIQKRFKMITKNKIGKFSFLKYAMGVFAALSITMCFAVTNTSSKEIEKVVVKGEISSSDAQKERNGALTDQALAKAEIEGLKGKLPEDIEESVLMVNNESAEQKNNAVQQVEKPVNSIIDPIKKDSVFVMVEYMPQFPGGEEALWKWIAESIKYPIPAAQNGIQGKVYVTFVVESDGSVSRAKVVRGVDPSLDAEALRVVNALPKWKPGYQKGKAVPVSFTVPINFKLNGPNEGKKIDETIVTGYDQKGVATKDSIYQTCEVMPVFPGGETEVRKFIANNIRYPKEALKYGEVGKVYVTFIVAKDGAVEKVRIVRSVSPALDNEAIRVVSTMPNWIPGKDKGEPVNVQYTMPVNFQLQ
jgi:TonB family protein